MRPTSGPIPARSRTPAATARFRRGTALVAVIVALLIISLAALSLGASNGLLQQSVADEIEGSRTFYAGESAANMSMREIVSATDADGDGSDGSISDDGNAANNPVINGVSITVSKTVSGSNVTLTCTATSTNARRRIVMSLTQ